MTAASHRESFAVCLKQSQLYYTWRHGVRENDGLFTWTVSKRVGAQRGDLLYVCWRGRVQGVARVHSYDAKRIPVTRPDGRRYTRECVDYNLIGYSEIAETIELAMFPGMKLAPWLRSRTADKGGIQ